LRRRPFFFFFSQFSPPRPPPSPRLAKGQNGLPFPLFPHGSLYPFPSPGGLRKKYFPFPPSPFFSPLFFPLPPALTKLIGPLPPPLLRGAIFFSSSTEKTGFPLFFSFVRNRPPVFSLSPTPKKPKRFFFFPCDPKGPQIFPPFPFFFPTCSPKRQKNPSPSSFPPCMREDTAPFFPLPFQDL